MSEGSGGPVAGPNDRARPPATSDDWPAQAADLIVRVVGQVRDKTTGPALTVARGIVYGLIAAILGGTCAVLLAIAGVRALDVALPDAWVGEDHTWVAHLLIGIVFVVLGTWLWSKRRAPEDAS